MNIYAKIDMTYNPGAVVNIQVCQPTDYFDPLFTWIDITNLSPAPFQWCSYDGSSFSTVIAAPYISTIPSEIPTGSNTTFTPFNLSSDSYGFPVSVSDSIITIGCQSYDYKWLRYCLYMINTQDATQIGLVSTIPNGVSHNGQFNIMQADVDAIYSALCTLV